MVFNSDIQFQEGNFTLKPYHLERRTWLYTSRTLHMWQWDTLIIKVYLVLPAYRGYPHMIAYPKYQTKRFSYLETSWNLAWIQFENKCEGAKRPIGGRVWEGGVPHGREIFQFWGSESCNLVHAVIRLLTLYLIRFWIKIIPYSRTHTETGSEYLKKWRKKKIC